MEPYTTIESGNGYKIKHIIIKSGETLPLQIHHHHIEYWIIISGTAEIKIDNKIKFLCKGENEFIQSGIKHGIKNPGIIPLEIIEVQMGEYLEENDIVLFE